MLVNVGDTLAGKYRVDRILGIGGMGMVVAATNMDLDQRVALKFMLPDALQNETAMERFIREGKAAAKLKSEHICRVHDVGTLHTGAPYIVMEYMEGGDFSGLIKQRGQLAIWEAVDLILQALEGLAEAHANHIVHRDLKPGNLFVTVDNDGSALIKVLDFGISKSTVGGAATRTGDIMGSPAYMSPEQMASSKNVDARADVWAMGVILYQAVTGKMPFESDTLPGLCMAVMNSAPADMVTLRLDMSPAFAAVVMKCLEKRPELRPANVAELAALLAPFGGAGAQFAASRVAKVLGRNAKPTPSTGIVAQGMPTAGLSADQLVAPTMHTNLASAARAGTAGAGPGVSTLQASASELSYQSRDKKSKRMGVIIGAAVATLAVGGIVIAAVFGGGGDKAAKQPDTKVETRIEQKDPPKADPPKVDPPKVDATKVDPPPPPREENKLAVDPPPPPPEQKKTVAPPPRDDKKVVKKSTFVAPPQVVKKTTPPPEEKKTVVTPPPEDKKTTTAPVDPDDKWTHMQHDKDGKK